MGARDHKAEERARDRNQKLVREKKKKKKKPGGAPAYLPPRIPPSERVLLLKKTKKFWFFFLVKPQIQVKFFYFQLIKLKQQYKQENRFIFCQLINSSSTKKNWIKFILITKKQSSCVQNILMNCFF
eukprot:TRINITY_DN384_c0_g1_i2.p3 TRINITY_DN384_c0_g1~~TRINITY_DN384_c0_g1_i2.p3  ORF type:complete len:127 (+),score=22.41 TRINITY_DN384_c0_g1_i2:738-1118(+)